LESVALQDEPVQVTLDARIPAALRPRGRAQFWISRSRVLRLGRGLGSYDAHPRVKLVAAAAAAEPFAGSSSFTQNEDP